jgi:20S proteasome alpha/beta subunit
MGRELIFCSDQRIETSSYGSETEFKFHKVTDEWAALIAGDVGRAHELLGLYTCHLIGKAFDEAKCLTDLRVPPQQMKRTLANEHVANATGLSLDEFLDRGQSSLPPAMFETIWNDIARIEIGCQIILAPISANWALFLVDADGSVEARKSFCSIGSGASSAEAWLHFREQEPSFGFMRTTVHLLEAKRFAENAPGVGKKTTLTWIDKEKNLHIPLGCEEIEEGVWKEYGPRPTEDAKVSFPKDLAPSPWTQTGIG